ncbi:MAG: hypothetical protein EOP43_05735 [Sphingobacteriaceae bacterium]|nr:MAG: hypothetical protein EOP43_05735 [Sphingobacteriaceae bacterium]
MSLRYNRVAFNQLQQYEYKYQVQSQIVPEIVGKECYNLTGIGVRKLLDLICKPMERDGIDLGRDACFAH